MPVDLPPCPPAYVVTQQSAQTTLRDMKQRLPNTIATSAAPSPVCGLTEVQLENGNTLYVDKTGRYLILGLMVDMQTGRTINGSLELNTGMQ